MADAVGATPKETDAMKATPTNDAPRTYQSAFQWDDEGRPRLLTAEEWLEEEADIDAALDATPDADNEDDGPSRAGTLRAIRQEIATLRRDKALWAEQATALIAKAGRPRHGTGRHA